MSESGLADLQVFWSVGDIIGTFYFPALDC